MKKSSIIGFICVVVLSIYGCALPPQVWDFHYDAYESRIYFKQRNAHGIRVQIYWEDSLLCTSYAVYDDNTGYNSMEALPADYNYSYSIKSYFIDMCYTYAVKRQLLLRYKLVTRDDLLLLDTMVNIVNPYSQEIARRIKKGEQIEYPRFNLRGTDFNFFNSIDFLAFVKAELYKKGIRDVEYSILNNTAVCANALLTSGFKRLIIPSNRPTNIRDPKYIPHSLYAKFPDRACKVYLLLTSLSGKNDTDDFRFNCTKEIEDFIAYEYAYNFENAILNNGSFINVPVKMIGNHKYHFVQILWSVYILDDGDSEYFPIGYIVSYNPSEVRLLNANTEYSFKIRIARTSAMFVNDLFIINYCGSSLPWP